MGGGQTCCAFICAQTKYAQTHTHKHEDQQQRQQQKQVKRQTEAKKQETTYITKQCTQINNQT